MKYRRMPIEAESPEEKGYSSIECNLAESSVSDTKLDINVIKGKDIDLQYQDHRGLFKLRKLIAEDYQMHPEEILLTPGASGALFIVATSLLERESTLTVMKPNYATNLETPHAIGCTIQTLNLSFERTFKLESEHENLVKVQKPDLVSLTHPHNPSGQMLDSATLKKWVELTEETKSGLLVDETYRDLSFQPKTPVAATLGEHVITISSVSKALGLPGLRIGWIACKNREWNEQFLAAKEQIVICNSIVDEYLACHYYENRQQQMKPIQERIQNNLKCLKNWLNKHPFLKAHAPMGGVVVMVQLSNKVNTEGFYSTLENKYHTAVGPGHWFEMPDKYFRLGFGWPDETQFAEGLKRIDHAINENLI